MGNISAPVAWQGLWIWVTPAGFLPPVLLTGTIYPLVVHVRNIASHPVKGRLVFKWPISEREFIPFVMTVDLPVGGETSAPTAYKPTKEGSAEFRLLKYVAYPNEGLAGNLRQGNDQDFGKLAESASGTESVVLLSSAVRDAAEWMERRAWERGQRRLSWLTILASAIAAGAAVVGVVLTVVFHIW